MSLSGLQDPLIARRVVGDECFAAALLLPRPWTTDRGLDGDWSVGPVPEGLPSLGVLGGRGAVSGKVRSWRWRRGRYARNGFPVSGPVLEGGLPRADGKSFVS